MQGFKDGEEVLEETLQYEIVAYTVRKFRRTAFDMTEETQNTSIQDPRLGAFPEAWEHVDEDETADDLECVHFYQHKITGWLTDPGPRRLRGELGNYG